MIASTGIYVGGGALLIGFGLAVVCALKGKWAFALFGLVFGVFWLIGATRLAKPRSWWARRIYEDDEIKEAERRFSRKPIPYWGGSPFRETCGYCGRPLSEERA
jgi:hypothetical protein